MVVDNEAGMEHISRGVLPNMQTAILVSDCSRRGIQAVGRIKKLIEECDMHPQQIGLMAFLELLLRIWNLTGLSVRCS